jgi:tetratricopeptide (TPR) repeat protein
MFMTELDTPSTAFRHPWLKVLENHPAREVAKLLAGQAAIDPYGDGEPGDAAQLLFNGLGPSDPAVQALDAGLSKWFEEQRKRRSRDRRDHQVQVLRGIRAFDTITRVPVKACVGLLWKEYIKWYSWADQQVPGTGADLRAAFLRTLALTQERLDDRPAEANIPFWLVISGRAGRSYPDHYVDLAILGLRRLPLPAIPERDLSKEGLCMVALANWASGRTHLGDAFAWRWDALRHAFPRFLNHWETIFKHKILPRQNELAADLYGYWAKSAGVQVPATPQGRGRGRARHDDEGKQEVLSFVSRISDLKGSEAIATARKLVDERERWAQERGLVEPLAMTACNVGQRLLRVGRAPLRQRAETALGFAMTTLRWKPQHTHGWSLWRDALVALRRSEEAELVAWESINRFPEVPVLAVNLCQIWLSDERRIHARALLEETLEKTGYIVALTMLAGLLLRAGNADDSGRAEQLLQYGRRRRNVVSMNMLAGLLMRKGPANWEEAVSVLEDAIAVDEENPRSKVLLGGLLLRRGNPKDLSTVERLFREAAERDDAAVCMLSEFLLSRGEPRDIQEAKQKLKTIADRNPVANAMLRRLLRNSGDVDDAASLQRMEATAADTAIEDDTDFGHPVQEENLFWAEPSGAGGADHEGARTAGPAQGDASADAGSRHLRNLVNQAFAQVITESIPALSADPVGEAEASELKAELVSTESDAIGLGHAAVEQSAASMLRTITPSAEAAQSAFITRRGLPREKAGALRALRKLADEDDLPFARFLLLGSLPSEEPREEDIGSGSFGLALYSALRAKSPQIIGQLRSRFPQEALLCSLAEAYLANSATDGRSLSAEYLRRARLEGSVIGPASFTFMQLTQNINAPLDFANDNDARLMASLGKTFESAALAAQR